MKTWKYLLALILVTLAFAGMLTCRSAEPTHAKPWMRQASAASFVVMRPTVELNEENRLEVTETPVCGATAIEPTLVITAAHCLKAVMIGGATGDLLNVGDHVSLVTRDQWFSTGSGRVIGQVVHMDLSRDIAKIELPERVAHWVPMARPYTVGASVFIVSHVPTPFGVQEALVTAVSGELELSRPMPRGASGSGVFDSEGRLIGVMTKTYSKRSVAAIPAIEWIRL